MPNAGIHLLLARRALRHWSSPGADPPFPLHAEGAVAAFLHGTIIPDAGYFPRSDRLFSELAHLTRTGALVRALVEEADSACQLAHAWGWATHVLGDLAIHPLINQAHGELMHGTRSRPVTSTDDEAGHMRLEYGLDAAAFDAYPELDDTGFGRTPDAGHVQHVARAYGRVFGWGPAQRWLVRAHRRTGRMVRLALLGNRIHAARASERPLHALIRAAASPLAPPRRWLPGGWNRSSAVQALLSPLPPPKWLLDEVSGVLSRIGEWLDELRALRLRNLRDHDLVTGAPEAADVPTPRTALALRQLEVRKRLPAAR